MSFLDERIDAKITRGVTFSVTNPGRSMIRTQGGGLTQKFSLSSPIHRCDLSHGLRSADDFQTVLDIWYLVHFTPYTGFRVKDWRDYIATRSNTTVELVSGTTWQLQRKHSFGAFTYARDIYKPNDDVVIYDGSGNVLSATVDTATGIATVPTGTPATWAGTFDIPMTFTDNEWTGSLEVHTQNLHISSDPIKLEEVPRAAAIE